MRDVACGNVLLVLQGLCVFVSWGIESFPCQCSAPYTKQGSQRSQIDYIYRVEDKSTTAIESRINYKSRRVEVRKDRLPRKKSTTAVKEAYQSQGSTTGTDYCSRGKEADYKNTMRRLHLVNEQCSESLTNTSTTHSNHHDRSHHEPLSPEE